MKNSFLRTPAWAVKAFNLPSSMQLLPSDDSLIKFDDNTVFYACRLRDTYVDGLALKNGERGYIQNAISKSRSTHVIKSPGRDPMIIFNAISRRPLPTPSAIKFHDDPVDMNLAIALPAEQSQFFCTQQLNANFTQEHPANASINQKFKNYNILVIPASTTINKETDITKEQSHTIMPRNAIITSIFAPRMMKIQLRKEEDATKMLADLRQLGGIFHHISTKGSIRIMFEQNVDKDLLKQAASIPGVLLTTCDANPEDKTWPTRVSTENFLNGERFAEKENDTIIIRRVDGNPISPALFASLVQVLADNKITNNKTNLRLKDGQVFGPAGGVEVAAALHEKIFGGDTMPISSVWLQADAHALAITSDSLTV